MVRGDKLNKVDKVDKDKDKVDKVEVLAPSRGPVKNCVLVLTTGLFFF